MRSAIRHFFNWHLLKNKPPVMQVWPQTVLASRKAPIVIVEV